MKHIHERCFYTCGPYKEYCGHAEYDEEAEIFHGQVIGTRDVITFQGKTLKELRAAFIDSVDDYLAFCKETGEPAEKPFSGKFVARLDPELHRRISIMAQLAGKSLNQFICDCLEAAAQKGPLPDVCDAPLPSKKGRSPRTPAKNTRRESKKPQRSREKAMA